MTNNILTWLRHNFPVLFEDKMPIWMTIIASLIAAAGAYFITPSINRQFQIDATRTAHLSETTKNLNVEIILLSQKVRRLNEALINQSTEAPAIRDDCLDLVTKLQWMLVDLRIVLASGDDKVAVDRLAASMGKLKNALDEAVDARAETKILGAMSDLGARTRDVLDRLYVKAALKTP